MLEHIAWVRGLRQCAVDEIALCVTVECVALLLRSLLSHGGDAHAAWAAAATRSWRAADRHRPWSIQRQPVLAWRAVRSLHNSTTALLLPLTACPHCT